MGYTGQKKLITKKSCAQPGHSFFNESNICLINISSGKMKVALNFGIFIAV